MRATASSWLAMGAVSESKNFARGIDCVKLGIGLPDRLRFSGHQHLGL